MTLEYHLDCLQGVEDAEYNMGIRARGFGKVVMLDKGISTRKITRGDRGLPVLWPTE